MKQSKIKIEALVALYNSRQERFDRSRNIQWKINGLLWAAIVVITGYLYTNMKQPFDPVAGLAVSISIIVLHTFTIYKIQMSLDWDRRIMIKYHTYLNDQLDLPQDFKKFFLDDTHRRYGWYIIQLSTTALIVTLSTILLCVR